jgi:hypothetical protein
MEEPDRTGDPPEIMLLVAALKLSPPKARLGY